MISAEKTSIRWAAAAALVVGIGLFTTTHGDVGWDGPWVLQVVSRMEAGDILYRDVFAGVPPLTFYAASAVTRVLGVELFALRLLLVAVVGLSYLASADLLRRLTGTRRYDPVLALMMMAWALPANVALYQPLANLFLLTGIDAAAWWCERSERRRPLPALPLWVAGATAGLSFVSKQTVGLYALAAIAAIVAIDQWRRRSSGADLAAVWGWTGAAFAIAAGTVLVPVAASGGWAKFLDYGFLNKSTYLRVAGVPYRDELAMFLRTLAPGGSFDLLAFVKHQPILLPLLVPAAVIVSWQALRRADRTVVVLTGLATAELLTLFPRVDIDHVIPGVPGMLVVLLAAWHKARARWPGTGTWRTGVAVLLVVAAGVTVRLGASAAAIGSDRCVWSELPHLRHVLMPDVRLVELAAQARALRKATPSGRLFLLVPNAGLYYLISGLNNPTPFDYPLSTAFGMEGEAAVAREIAEGRLRQVCMTPLTGPMAPGRLQRAVLARLYPVSDLGACTLYARPE